MNPALVNAANPMPALACEITDFSSVLSQQFKNELCEDLAAHFGFEVLTNADAAASDGKKEKRAVHHLSIVTLSNSSARIEFSTLLATGNLQTEWKHSPPMLIEIMDAGLETGLSQQLKHTLERLFSQ